MRCSGLLGLSVACAVAFAPEPEPLTVRVNAEDRWDSLIEYHSQRAGVDWLLVKAIMLVESNGDPNAISPKGARGLMQLMPATFWQWLDGTMGVGGPPPQEWSEVMNPDANLRVATRHIAWLTESLSRRVLPDEVDEAVLAAYFAGEGFLRRHVMRYGSVEVTHLPTKTRSYVRKASQALVMLRRAEHGGQ